MVAAAVLMLAALPAGADRAKDDFDELFGAQLKKVKSTRTVTDDVRLAKNMLAAVKETDLGDELVALVCNSVYELGANSPTGLDAASEAMTLLAKKVPARQLACQEKLAMLDVRRCKAAKGIEKVQIGELCVMRLIDVADAKARAEQTVDALKLLRTAADIARQIRSDSAQAVKAKTRQVELTRDVLRKVALKKAVLKSDPENAAARRELISLYLVELDNPTRAGEYLLEDSDETLRTYVPLAAGSIEKVNEGACLELGKWYQGFVDKAGRLGRPFMLRRAKRYYERFLSAHEAKDVARLRVVVQLKEIDEELAKQQEFVTGWIGLLKFVNLKKHVRLGWWVRGGDKIGIKKKGQYSRVAIPVTPVGDYELEVSFVRTEGYGPVAVLLPIGRRGCNLMMGYGKDQTSSLVAVYGKSEGSSGAAKETGLSNNKPHTAMIRVKTTAEGAKVTVDLDKTRLLTWQGDPAHCRRPSTWQMSDNVALGLGGHESKIVFSSVRLRMLSGKVAMRSVNEVAVRLAELKRTEYGDDDDDRRREARDRIRDAIKRLRGGRHGRRP